MKKLIDLLNKYEKEVKKSEYYEWEKGIGGPNNLFRRDTRDEEGSHIYSDTADTYVISKKYGFVGWLVESDKIDLFKSGIDELPKMFGYDYESVECKSDRLVMILSIQDNPIEFLVSILK